LAPDMPPNSHKAHRSDPALIEYPAFDHVRYLRGDNRDLASACACEDQVGGWVCLNEESWRVFMGRGGGLNICTAVLIF